MGTYERYALNVYLRDVLELERFDITLNKYITNSKIMTLFMPRGYASKAYLLFIELTSTPFHDMRDHIKDYLYYKARFMETLYPIATIIT